MDGRMDQWLDGWANGWMNVWMDGWMDGSMVGWMGTQVDRQVDRFHYIGSNSTCCRAITKWFPFSSSFYTFCVWLCNFPFKIRSLLPHSLNLGWPWICSGQQNMAEVMICQFQAQVSTNSLLNFCRDHVKESRVTPVEAIPNQPTHSLQPPPNKWASPAKISQVQPRSVTPRLMRNDKWTKSLNLEVVFYAATPDGVTNKYQEITKGKKLNRYSETPTGDFLLLEGIRVIQTELKRESLSHW